MPWGEGAISRQTLSGNAQNHGVSSQRGLRESSATTPRGPGGNVGGGFREKRKGQELRKARERGGGDWGRSVCSGHAGNIKTQLPRRSQGSKTAPPLACPSSERPAGPALPVHPTPQAGAALSGGRLPASSLCKGPWVSHFLSPGWSPPPIGGGGLTSPSHTTPLGWHGGAGGIGNVFLRRAES